MAKNASDAEVGFALTGSAAATSRVTLGRIPVGGVNYPGVARVNWTLHGTFVGSVYLEKSYDNGVTWVPVTYIDGSTITWTGPLTTQLEEFEDGVLYAANATVTSGTVNFRISR